MSKKNIIIWKIIQVICWIIFIGLCVETGTFLFNYLYSLYNPIVAKNVYSGLDLSTLYHDHTFLYHTIFSFLIGAFALKAFVFYLVTLLFNTLNLQHPFSQPIANLVSKISYVALITGLFSSVALGFTEKLITKGFKLTPVLKFWNDNLAFIMMAAIIFVIALIFKKGIELQNENDLTI